MKDFSEKIKRELGVVTAMNKQMLKNFDKLYEDFGYEVEGRTDKTIKEFWSILADFKTNVRNALEKNEKVKIQIKKQQEQEERKRLTKEKRKLSPQKMKKGLFDQMAEARKGSVHDVIENQKKKVAMRRARGQGRRGIRRKKR